VAFFARHAPGITPSELRRMTPAESRAIAKAIVQSNGARFV
jgi:hypothetical protein